MNLYKLETAYIKRPCSLPMTRANEETLDTDLYVLETDFYKVPCLRITRVNSSSSDEETLDTDLYALETDFFKVHCSCS